MMPNSCDVLRACCATAYATRRSGADSRRELVHTSYIIND